MHRAFLLKLVAGLTVLLLSSCAPIALVETWQRASPGGAAGVTKFKTLLVAGKLRDSAHRRICEEKIASLLQRKGIAAYTGDELFLDAPLPSWQALSEAVGRVGADGVVIIQVMAPDHRLDEQKLRQRIGHVSTYPVVWLPAMFPDWTLYSHYGLTPFCETPVPLGYGMLTIQASLFDTASQRLVWAGKFDVLAPDAVPTNDAEVAGAIIEALVEVGLI